MAISAEDSAIRNMNIPYPSSWIDRIIEWIDRLPGPIWLFYLLSVLGSAVVINAMFWIDGSLPIFLWLVTRLLEQLLWLGQSSAT